MRTLRVALDELHEHGRARATTDRCAVLVTMVDGEVHAIDDTCPHRGTSLADGLIRDGVVTCPAHLWQFDVRSGARHDTAGEPQATYPVRVLDRVVEIEVPDAVPEPTLRELLLAHARGGRA